MTTAPVQPPLSTSGRCIVGADGRRVRLAGVNWYGAHEDDGVAAGLERTGRRELARRIARHGFNSVRLPFSLWMTEQTIPVPDEYLAANPDLSGATPIQVYDACVEALTDAGLIVIPNCHTLDAGWCCSDDDESGLWFNDRWPAVKYFAAWRDMAARYVSNPLVAGMDIMNEPRRSRVRGRVLSPAWGTGHTTDISGQFRPRGDTCGRVVEQRRSLDYRARRGLVLVAAQPDPAPGHCPGDRPAPVRLGRPGAVGPAGSRLARGGESGGAGHPQGTDPAPHRSRRQLTRSPRTD
jgi:Cellulase (glycosyl hydrolase family 5)